MSSGAYLSSDDSALLRIALKGYAGEACLEIGAGNGGGLIELAKGFRLTVGTDILRPSDSSWRRDSVDFVLADAASCFRDHCFELVAFNPPYLPSEGLADRAVDGGDGGEAVTFRFLDEAMRVTKLEGRIVLLLSSENALAPIKRICERNGFSMKRLEAKHLFYETLSVYEISLNGNGQP
jgi:release factor glutamine methyltransferase